MGKAKITQKFDFILVGTIKNSTFKNTKEAFWGSLYVKNLRDILGKSTSPYIKLKVYSRADTKDEFLLQALLPSED